MIVPIVLCIALFSIGTTTGCNIIIRVKSKTSTPFSVQIITPNGTTTEKKDLKTNERLIFHEKAKQCGLGQFQIKTYSKTKEENVKVTLNGIGAVNYDVGDDLIPKQISRQGAECHGQCAPLAITPEPKTLDRTTKA